MTPAGRTLRIAAPDRRQAAARFVATHLAPEQVAAHFDRLARYGRRRRAAERGEDWQAVR